MFISAAEPVPKRYVWRQRFQVYRRKVWYGLTALLLALVLSFGYHATGKLQATITAQAPKTTTVATAAQAVAVTGGAPAVTPQATPAINITPAPAACTPATYGAPSVINLSGLPEGLTIITDSTSHYAINGSMAAHLENQIQQCAPLGDDVASGSKSAAQTGYSLVWRYNVVHDSAGVCSLSNAQVGLHLNMIMPSWQPTAGTNAGLAANWQRFITSLTTHENGHVAIDQQYARQLLTDMQTFPAASCDGFTANLEAKLAGEVAALNAANVSYDAATHHGATQGAIIP